jgi:hypothetical protein
MAVNEAEGNLLVGSHDPFLGCAEPFTMRVVGVTYRMRDFVNNRVDGDGGIFEILFYQTYALGFAVTMSANIWTTGPLVNDADVPRGVETKEVLKQQHGPKRGDVGRHLNLKTRFASRRSRWRSSQSSAMSGHGVEIIRSTVCFSVQPTPQGPCATERAKSSLPSSMET